MQLRLALQKSGRLSEQSVSLLKSCGIQLARNGGKLRAVADNYPLELLFLRDDDIPGYVHDGVADIGIIGENVLLEKGYDLDLVERLGFARCRLALAIPKGHSFDGIKDLEGKHIATSYPVLLKRYLDEQGVSASIHEISGSVEIAPGIGLADAICDIVSTGSTLMSNGLKEATTVMRSEAVLVARPSLAPAKTALLEGLLFRLQSVQRAQGFRYILMNVPNESVEEVCGILPGMRSPTVLPLADRGWSSVHSVIQEDAFWDIIDQLKGAGAEGMLIIPIEKMVT